MLRRTALLPGLLGLAALGFPQLLTGTAGSSSSTTISDSAYYTPMSDGQVQVENYFQMGTGTPNANFSTDHSFSSVVIPGTGGLTGGEETGTVVDNLVNGSSAATFSSTLTAYGNLSTSVSGAGSDSDVQASVSGEANDQFLFTLSTLTDLNLSGAAGFSSAGPESVQLMLTNVNTSQVIYLLSFPGSFDQSLALGAGDYSLTGNVQSGPNFHFNAFQGTLSDQVGAFTSQINYTADFTPPSGTPEPSTLGLAAAATFGTMRRIRAKRKRT